MKASFKPGNFKLNSFKLTREMKLALTGVALIGAVGGWYTWNAARAPETAEVAAPSGTPFQSATQPTETPTPASSAPAATTPAPEAKSATPEPSTANGVTIVRPKNPVKVRQIPFLTAQPAEESAGAKPAATVAAAPDDALPNPFRPFEVQASAPESAPTPASAPTPVSAPTIASAPTPLPVPSVPAAPNLSPINRARAVAGSFSGGLTPGNVSVDPPIVLSPPKISGAVPFPKPQAQPTTPPKVQAAAPKMKPGAKSTAPTAAPIPVPIIAGTPTLPSVASAPGLEVAPPVAVASAAPSATLPSTNPPGASLPTVSAGTPLPVAPNVPVAPNIPVAPIKPRVKPPTPTLQAPSTASLGTPSALPTAAPSAPSAAIQPDAAPPVIAELAPLEGEAQAAPPSPLDAFVAEQNLAFNAAVLGPVNTGILNSKGGYLVVTVGQALPESEVVVQDITATSVTLTLGGEQKVLELGAQGNPENAAPDMMKPQDPAADEPTSGEAVPEAPTAQAPSVEAPVSAAPASPASPDLSQGEPDATGAASTDPDADTAAAPLPDTILVASIPATPLSDAAPSASELAATDFTPANPTDDSSKGEP